MVEINTQWFGEDEEYRLELDFHIFNGCPTDQNGWEGSEKEKQQQLAHMDRMKKLIQAGKVLSSWEINLDNPDRVTYRIKFHFPIPQPFKNKLTDR